VRNGPVAAGAGGAAGDGAAGASRRCVYMRTTLTSVFVCVLQSSSQLRDLPWRIKEQVLIALFREVRKRSLQGFIARPH